MDNSRKERVLAYHRLLGMQTEVERELKKIPGVAGVSTGVKVTGNTVSQQLCFRVYVHEKRSRTDLPAGELIPAFVRGIATDVDELPKNITASGAIDDENYRPLSGGCKISSSNSFVTGTLGCMAFDTESEDQDVVLLTAGHLLMSDGEQAGHPVGQPGFCCDAWCCRCGEMAKFVRGIWGEENVDCAIAKLTKGHEDNWTNEILEMGLVTSIRIDPETGNAVSADRVVAGDTVFKRGMGSGLTEGIVVDAGVAAGIPVTYKTRNGDVTHVYQWQILIHPKSPDKPFTTKGDSGAVVLNHKNQVVALYFADNEVRNDQNVLVTPATRSYANSIDDVMRLLKISIPETGTLKTLPIENTAAVRPLRKDALQELTAMVGRHPDGEPLLALFKNFGKEVLHLINTDREVKVAWNRLHGPAFVAHLMQKIKNLEYNLPMKIEGISWQRLLSKMSVVLEKKGSRPLAEAVEQNSIKTLGLARDLLQTINQPSYQPA